MSQKSSRKIRDICNINHSSINDDSFDMDEIEYVDISSTGQGRIESTETYNISEAPSRAKRVVKDGDVIISRVRPGRKQYAFVRNPPKNLVVSTGFIVLRPDKNTKIHPEYLYYATTSDKFMDEMERRKTGSTYPSTNISEVKSMQITVPEYQEQLNLVNTISPIDRKIELNRELAELLEETAHAIYESWFEAYEPYDIPDNREYPEEFEKRNLNEILRFQRGYSYSGDDITEKESKGKYPMVNLGSIEPGGGYNRDNMKYLNTKPKDKYKVNNGDLVISHTDMTQERDILGSPLIVPSFDSDTYISHHLYSIKDNKLPEEYLYFYFLSDKFKPKAENYASGTTVLSFSSDISSEIDLHIPPNNDINEYTKRVENLFLKIEALRKERLELEQLRNYLLPQLLSGEVIIKELEDQSNKEKDKSQGDKE